MDILCSLLLPAHVSIILWRTCACVNFKERSVAETAIQAWVNGVDVNGNIVSVT
jgi:hypothetical protein